MGLTITAKDRQNEAKDKAQHERKNVVLSYRWPCNNSFMAIIVSYRKAGYSS